MISADLIETYFSLNHRLIHAQTEGLTNEDSLLQPVSRGNCLNWVLGHIVATRNSILQLLGEALIWDDDTAARYGRGSAPITTALDGLPLERILGDFDRAQSRIVLGFAHIAEHELDAPSGDATIRERLAFLHFHEAYHIGQLSLLRRLAGRAGIEY